MLGAYAALCWEALQAAWLPFAVAWKAPWWQSVARPNDVSAAGEGAFRAGLVFHQRRA